MLSIRNYIISGISILIFGLVTGWKLTYSYYKVKELTIIKNENEQTISNLNSVMDNQVKTITYFNKQDKFYESKIIAIREYADRQTALSESQAEYINKHNRLEHKLLIMVGALKSKHLSKDAGIASESSDTRAPLPSPVEYGKWAAGLRVHDNNCVMHVNALLNLWDYQMGQLNDH